MQGASSRAALDVGVAMRVECVRADLEGIDHLLGRFTPPTEEVGAIYERMSAIAEQVHALRHDVEAGITRALEAEAVTVKVEGAFGQKVTPVAVGAPDGE